MDIDKFNLALAFETPGVRLMQHNNEGEMPLFPPTTLRKMARRRLKRQLTDISHWPYERTQSFVSKLEVQGEELKIRNEHLLLAKTRVDIARDIAQYRYRDLFENALVGYLILDSEGCIQEANRAAVVLLETTKSAVIGQPFSTFVAASFQEALHHFCLVLITTQVAQTIELKLTKNGAITSTVIIEGVVEPNATYGDYRVRCALIDITERKGAEDKLRIADRVYESIADAVVITDPTGYIKTVNQAFTRITGYSESDTAGVILSNLVKPRRSGKTFYQEVRSSIDNDGFWQGEISSRRKSGEIFAGWLTAYRLDDDQNQPLSIVIIFSDISQLKSAQRKNEYLTSYDPLTGLPNRRLFQERLQQAILQARYDARQVALLVLCPDFFQKINDTFNHEVGDAVLVQMASKLAKLVRKIDTTARLGGDQFAVILNDITSEEAGFISRRLVMEVADAVEIQQKKQRITLSAGMALYPQDGEDAYSLYQAASIAMRRAQEEGRNQLRLYESALHRRLLEESAIEEGLYRALANEELRLVYQPQFDAHNPERLVGAEALLRWQDPEKGAISPGQFIPIAERSTLISALTWRVITLLCRQVNAWQSDGLKVPQISFNVSPLDFKEKSFAATLFQMMDQHGVTADQLKIELTESALTEYSDLVQKEIHSLHAYGIDLSIDDFGTGYSSLSNLKWLPLTELKIDKSFVDGLGANAHDNAIAGASLAMAQALGLRTVAEGVENAQQLAWLQANGCDRIQGFLLSRPLEVQDFQNLLTS
ncbi:EAL domain-containing protein [Halomonas vilamensis]|uniref:EAL domain-containing protein n=1 Tax=Vreelandella vilamensis TaxID=531309 RepID=A0ABU1H4I9_9GAMM|nr:EAL domain-containing protein [Halomonas vilamensis]MDR5899216.1 EAL domain-containing protein [Halomonas vilamensis]